MPSRNVCGHSEGPGQNLEQSERMREAIEPQVAEALLAFVLPPVSALGAMKGRASRIACEPVDYDELNEPPALNLRPPRDSGQDPGFHECPGRSTCDGALASRRPVEICPEGRQAPLGEPLPRSHV